MINSFIRKLKTAGSLIISEPKPIKVLGNKIQKNIKEFTVKIAQKIFIYETKLGFKFVCIPQSPTSVYLYSDDAQYEEIEIKIASDWLNQGDVALDIGANVGYLSALFASRVNSLGKVISVEASPETFKHLEKTVQVLSLNQIYLENSCVTDTEGFVEFMVACDQSSWFGDVSQSLKINPQEEKLYKKERVKAVTIDSLINKYGLNNEISLVKIDIEGAEPLALKGASLLFTQENLPLFIIEVNRVTLANFDFDPTEILKFFSIELFDLYHIQRSTPDLTPTFQHGTLYSLPNPQKHNWPLFSNLIAIPKVGKYTSRRKQVEVYLPSIH
jgi:FkbM family methyltransferase